MSNRWWAFPVVLATSGALAGVMLIAFAAAIIYPTLPSLEALTDYQPKIPLRVYSADGKLIAEFGEERRAVVRIEDVPRPMTHAILAAEDERFYLHSGVDYMGVASILPRWCVRFSTSATRKTPTPGAFASTPLCVPPTRRWRTRRCATASWSTTGATATP